ncbi:MAG TPA: hypothetical protein VMX55_15395 [candidate division Zixibacteria bacterium]|nr:hypothetical protein [candidate division Zixibacteria bacterium]
MSTDERIYRQLEELSSTIIKALEGLEKEFSEYIEITDNRLQKLEDKIHKLESLSDVTQKGLVKAIESFPDTEKVSTLAHLSSQQFVEKPPIVSQPPPKPIETSTLETPTIPQNIPIPQPKPQESPVPSPTISRIPPVPTPPSFQPILQNERLTEPMPLPERPEIKKIEGSIAEELEEKKKKEEDKDKDDLMSALKTIDSL